MNTAVTLVVALRRAVFFISSRRVRVLRGPRVIAPLCVGKPAPLHSLSRVSSNAMSAAEASAVFALLSGLTAMEEVLAASFQLVQC